MFLLVGVATDLGQLEAEMNLATESMDTLPSPVSLRQGTLSCEEEPHKQLCSPPPLVIVTGGTPCRLHETWSESRGTGPVFHIG